MISDLIPVRQYTSQMKILNMVIPILMHFCSFISQTGALGAAKLITSNYFQQNITGYTVAIFDVIQLDVALQNQEQ